MEAVELEHGGANAAVADKAAAKLQTRLWAALDGGSSGAASALAVLLSTSRAGLPALSKREPFSRLELLEQALGEEDVKGAPASAAGLPKRRRLNAPGQPAFTLALAVGDTVA